MILAPMQPGAVVAERFEIESLAGSGAMGMIYRARDGHTGGAVALKILHKHAAEGAERFYREARVLAELRHPGIVRHIAHGQVEGRMFLAMEWLEGEDLSRRLARSQLSIAESITLVGRIADALAAVHACGVVHRDIKPGNLFLVGGDVQRVKLVDFGIVHLADQGRSTTRTGVIIGTPGYMAPEQARGTKLIDGRTDVFSLGCVLYKCLTGASAFEADGILAVVAKVLAAEVPRASVLRPEVPPLLDDLLARMLNKDPAARPRDVAAVAAELEALGTVEKIAAFRTSPVAHEWALTLDEQRIVSVILVGALPGDAAADRRSTPGAGTRGLEGSTTISKGAGGANSPPKRLRLAIAPYGARLEALEDGTLIATLSGVGAATDQAMQAARCALAIQAVLVENPIVLATGRGIVDPARCSGDVIDRATELLHDEWPTAPLAGDDEPTGVPPRVRVDDVTAALVDSRFDVRGGASWRYVERERDLLSSGRVLLGKPTTCVGRDFDLSVLTHLFDECVTEPAPRAVILTGVAGIGKSRLICELIAALQIGRGARSRGAEPQHEPRAEGTPRATVLTARGDPAAAGSAFGLLARVVRHAAGIRDGQPLEQRRRQLSARVAQHVPPAEAARVARFLGELAGVPFTDEHSLDLRAARLDDALMGDQMAKAWQDLLAAECASRPVLLVLEDLHWADHPSVKLLDATLRELRGAPLMVVAAGRPELSTRFPNLWRECSVRAIGLGELPRRASEKLVREVLGDAVTSDDVTRISEQAGGNAFYLEEMIRAAAEGGRGAAKAARSRGGFPETVLAMAQTRLEALGTDARRVLRAASIFGQLFWRDGLLVLLGGDKHVARIDKWLDKLVERELIAKRGDATAGEPEYVFRHALVREGAYAALTDGDRTLGHQLAAGWLEKSGAGGPLVIAEHYKRAGEPDRAIWWYVRAAEQALEGSEFDAAIDRAEQGIDSGASGEALGELCAIMAHAHGALGEHADAVQRGLEAMHWVGQGGDVWIAAAGVVGIAYMAMGDFTQSVSTLRQALAAAERIGLEHVTAAAKHALGLALARCGALKEARIVASEAVQACEALGDARLAVRSCADLAQVLELAGDLEGAEREARVAVERMAPPPSARAYALAVLARILVSVGRPANAVGAMREAMTILDSLGGIEEGESLVRLAHAEALDAAGHRVAASEAISVARARLLREAAKIGDPAWRESFLKNVPDNARTIALARAWAGEVSGG